MSPTATLSFNLNQQPLAEIGFEPSSGPLATLGFASNEKNPITIGFENVHPFVEIEGKKYYIYLFTQKEGSCHYYSLDKVNRDQIQEKISNIWKKISAKKQAPKFKEIDFLKFSWPLNYERTNLDFKRYSSITFKTKENKYFLSFSLISKYFHQVQELSKKFLIQEIGNILKKNKIPILQNEQCRLKTSAQRLES